MVFKEITGKVVEVMPFSNVSLTDLPPEIISRMAGLITILKTLGIVFIGYIIFLIIKNFLAWRRHKKIDKTHQIVLEIDRKLDILLGDKKKEKFKELARLEKEIAKHKKESKRVGKKKGLFRRLFKFSKKNAKKSKNR